MGNTNAEFNEEERAMLADLEKGEQSPAPVATDTAATASAEVSTTAAAEPAGQAAATDGAAKPVEGAQAAPEQPAAPQGDTRAALRAARRDAKRANERATQLEQEVADLKAGKTTPSTQVTDEELAELDENFPVAAKLAREVAELKAKLQTAPSKAAPKDDFEPVRYDPDTQEVIDSVPDLVNWQYDPATQDRFHAAIEMDKYLLTLPDWQNKPLNERLVEVTRRVKADVAPGEPKRDPQAVIDALTTDGPKRISDFKGGMQPDKSKPDYSRMTDEEIIASLPA